ncbi:MAG: Fe-S-containing hydro-lyase [Syntrophales bacterium]|jgi:fumarate hydratase subunit beta|nr:Fe-S-containing hydro-lyase [Syntrophales bacterium]
MPNYISLHAPLVQDEIEKLKAGDWVLLSGTIYTARDAAHKRLSLLFQEGNPFPFDVSGQVIYYVGPNPAQPGFALGSAGPTTSSRMDIYTPDLLAKGLKGMIGKGNRGKIVIEAIRKYKAVYFAAFGGLGALISEKIRTAEIIAYPDLGTEAIRRLEIVDFPLIVAIDCFGNNLYETEPMKFQGA